MIAASYFPVIAGLDPAIHRAKRRFDSLMDARVKPAHDELTGLLCMGLFSRFLRRPS
jgi:hypothetical protein